ncbi:MAG: hypothetical protein IJ217_04860 [Clostridia bacterium]|nr:hypothetical protein [Clostridia bacterium]
MKNKIFSVERVFFMKKNYFWVVMIVGCMLFSLIGCSETPQNVVDNEKVENAIHDMQEEEKQPVAETKVEEVIEQDQNMYTNKTSGLKFKIPENMTVASQSDLDALTSSDGIMTYEFQGSIINNTQFAFIQISTARDVRFALSTEQDYLEGIVEGILEADQEGKLLGQGKLKIGNRDYFYADAAISLEGMPVRAKAIVGRDGNDIIMIMLFYLDDSSLNLLLDNLQ